MKAVWTIARREIKVLFDHPTGYILLIVFVGINDFLFFRQAYLLNAATLRPMMDLLPWMFLFFVPAVTMRAVAEDTRTGTLEVVLAQPVTEPELLLGKYLGQVLFLWIALALTLPVCFGLAIGADLESGVMVAQYAGAALLALGLAGVGLWASAISANQITAFIIGVFVMFLLVLVGLDPLLVGLPPTLGNIAAQLGVLSHFVNIGRGVIDLRDAVYFVSLAGIFLLLGYLALMTRKLTPRGETLKRLRLGTVMLIAALVVTNLFGRRIGGRLDLTPGNAYTLSRATRELARNVPDLVTIKLFASKELPSEVSILHRDLRDLLSDYRSAGRGKIRIVFGDPASDSTMMQDARSLGIPSVQFNVVGQGELKVKEGYLGIAVQYAGQNKTIPFVQRSDDLEYRLSSFIRALTVAERPKVSLLTPAANPQVQRSFNQLREALDQNYDVRTLTLESDTLAPGNPAVIVVAGSPESLTDSVVERVRTYLAGGGGALVMASGMQLPEQSFFATPRMPAWNRVLEPYGVSVRSDMVFDHASNERVVLPSQFGRVLVPYPFWARVVSTRASVVNEQVPGAFYPWGSSLDTAGARPGTVLPLLVTSRAAGVKSSEVFLEPTQQFPTDSLSVRVVAALVNTLAAENDSGPPGRLVVVGNEDLVSDRNVQNAPENMSFVLNAVDWLSQDESLITIRAKERTPPPLVFSNETLRDTVKYANVGGVPGALILLGILRLLRRKRLADRPYQRGGAEAA
ncbi:MAG: Gldg family protein [Gemmatimonadetes bacterium]|nr:Gldg family protein [Gemmatimonadota bacterium]